MIALPHREVNDPAYCFDQQSRLLSLRQQRVKQLSLVSAIDLEKEHYIGIRAQEQDFLQTELTTRRKKKKKKKAKLLQILDRNLGSTEV